MSKKTSVNPNQIDLEDSIEEVNKERIEISDLQWIKMNDGVIQDCNHCKLLVSLIHLSEKGKYINKAEISVSLFDHLQIISNKLQ